jgi:hypothetical protein
MYKMLPTRLLSETMARGLNFWVDAIQRASQTGVDNDRITFSCVPIRLRQCKFRTKALHTLYKELDSIILHQARQRRGLRAS